MTASGPAASSTDLFFDESPFPALIAAEGGRIERASAALCAELGRSEAELRGKSVFDLLDGHARDAAVQALTALGAPGASGRFEAALPESAARPLTWVCRRSSDGAFVFIYLLTPGERAPAAAERPGAAEPTTPAATERRLQRSEMLLQMLLKNLPVILWTVNTEGIFTQSDGLGLRALGRKPGEAVGQNLFEVYSKAPGVPDAVRRALAGETNVMTVPVGKAVWFTTYIPVREDDKVVEVLGLAFDVTEREQAEQELRRRLDVIEAQRDAIRAMSLPIIQVSEGVLALPIIGNLDSDRAARMMETLLHAVVQAAAGDVILDLTGVGAVEDSTADHLVRVVNALSLVGARAIVTGIQPSVAQSIVALGADLSRVVTASNLKDGIRLCTSRKNGAAHAR